jgi:hypothetical protein
VPNHQPTLMRLGIMSPVAPAKRAHRPQTSVLVDPRPHVGSLGREVEAADDPVTPAGLRAPPDVADGKQARISDKGVNREERYADQIAGNG